VGSVEVSTDPQVVKSLGGACIRGGYSPVFRQLLPCLLNADATVIAEPSGAIERTIAEERSSSALVLNTTRVTSQRTALCGRVRLRGRSTPRARQVGT
jgi:hypothetical protein